MAVESKSNTPRKNDAQYYVLQGMTVTAPSPAFLWLYLVQCNMPTGTMSKAATLDQRLRAMRSLVALSLIFNIPWKHPSSFKSTLSPEDAHTFSTTTYKDLWEGLRAIEDEQGRRSDLRFMRRVEPFLVALESYAPIIEVFCQGFSPMAWAWGPIKLMLRLARQHSAVMDRILQAYADIAEYLPRMDRLHRTFGNTEEFKQILGLIYCDIIEFHQRTYKMFRRRAWHVWFLLDWTLFERRFKSILSRLTSHCDLLDKEAASIHFLEMKTTREKHIKDEEDSEQQRQDQMIQDVLGWLSSAEESQEDYLHSLSDQRQPETCNFIFEDSQISSWADGVNGPDVIWMTGKPGAGKSMLCSLIIENLRRRHEQSTVYFFCGDQSLGNDGRAIILRTLVNQLLRQNLDLCPLVHQAYLTKGSNKSSPKMMEILEKVLPTAKSTRIVLDGIDEYEDSVQRSILANLTTIQKRAGQHCRLLVVSRDLPTINTSMAQKCRIALNGRNTQSVNLYIKAKVVQLKILFSTVASDLWSRIEHTLQEKADGMFLWEKLVTDMLQKQMSEMDLEAAIDQLPEGLDEAYGRILDRIRNLSSIEKDRAFRVLFWACVAYRSINIEEVADGIALKPGQTALNKKTRSQNVGRHILDVCAPLLERSKRGVLDLVHFSAKQFLLHDQSGPFVDIVQAHFNAAFSCIVNLNSTLGIVPRYNNGESDANFETLLVQGAYGLQQYGHQYWAEHTVAYFESMANIDEQGLKLIDALETFSRVSRHNQFHNPQRVDIWMGEGSAHLTLTLQKLGQFPRTQHLVSVWLRFKTELKDHIPGLDDQQAQEHWQLDKDQTFLSLINKRLRCLREGLLKLKNSALPPHIDKIEYQGFLARFNFVCRLYDCGHGFDREDNRDRHEATHTVFFQCLQCDFSGRGFRTRKMLEQHTRTYHMSAEDFKIPSSLQAAGDSTKASNPRFGTSNGGARQSNCWNEQGRKIVQQTFGKMLSRVVSEMTVMDPDIELPDTDRNVRKPSPSTACLESIRAKIEAQQYQTVADFKKSVYQVLKNPQTLTLADSFEDVEVICDKEIKELASTVPNFASSQRSPLVSFSTNEAVGSLEIATGDSRPAQVHILSPPEPYWSEAEEAKFHNLVEMHGRDSNKIAECLILMTKNPEDVKKHLELIQSMRDDLVHLADAADARMQQDRELTLSETASDSPSSAEPNLLEGSRTYYMAEGSDGTPGLSATQANNTPATFVLRSEDLLNYKPHTKPASNPAPKPQSFLGVSETVSSRPKYERRKPDKGLCPYCKRAFHNEYAAQKHARSRHEATRRAWLCVDVSLDKNFFGQCKPCSKKKSYSSRHNAFKHLRGAHFTATTSNETLTRWTKETEERNPHSDGKHTEWLRANHSERLSDPWQANKRQKTDQDLELPRPRTLNSHDGQIYLPPIRGMPDQSSGLVPGLSTPNSNGEDMGQADQQEPSRPSKPQTSLFETDNLPPGLSFDNLLPGFSAAAPHNINSPITASKSALIRPDQIARLPHISSFERAVCQDEVEALCEILNDNSCAAEGKKNALLRLQTVSQEVYKGLMQWRQRDTFAPRIPFKL